MGNLHAFLNRIDEQICFNSLDHEALKQIVTLEWKQLSEHFKEEKLTITLSDQAKEALVKRRPSQESGARFLLRTIQRDILNPLAIQILDGTLTEGSPIQVGFNENKFIFINKLAAVAE